MARGTVKVEVVKLNQRAAGWLPARLNDLQSWVRGVYSGIPSEFHDDVYIEIDANDSYYDESPTAVLTVFYCRPETDEEMNSREQKNEFGRREEEARELKLLQQLKLKYERTAV